MPSSTLLSTIHTHLLAEFQVISEFHYEKTHTSAAFRPRGRARVSSRDVRLPADSQSRREYVSVNTVMPVSWERVLHAGPVTIENAHVEFNYTLHDLSPKHSNTSQFIPSVHLQHLFPVSNDLRVPHRITYPSADYAGRETGINRSLCRSTIIGGVFKRTVKHSR